MKEIKLNDLIGLNSFPILKVSNEEMELMMKKLLVLLSLSLVSSLGFAVAADCTNLKAQCTFSSNSSVSDAKALSEPVKK